MAENVDLNRRRLLAALGAVGVVGTAGCSGETAPGDGGQSDGEPSPQGSFVVGTTSEVSSLNPLTAADEVTKARLALLFDYGGTVTTDVEFGPRWFESWDLSDDGTVVDYRLRDDLWWGGDHGALDAATFSYNVTQVWQRPPEENWTGFAYADDFFVDGEPIQYETTGEYTLRAELPAPRVNWLHEDPLLRHVPLPKTILAEYVPERDGKGLRRDERVAEAQFNGNLGAFEVGEWVRGARLVLRRNDEYYLRDADPAHANAPYFSEAVFQVFDDAATGYAALKGGDVDAMDVAPRREPEFRRAEGVKLWHSRYGDGISWLNLNHRANGWAPIRESRAVRQAFAHAVDKQVLIEEVSRGNANPVDTFTPRWGPYYDDAEVWVPEYDMETARAKLADGTGPDYGYDGDSFHGPDGQVTLRLVRAAGSETARIQAAYYVQQLEALGFDVEETSHRFATLRKDYLLTEAENPDWRASAFNGGPWDQATSAEPWDLLVGLGFTALPYAPWDAIRTTLSARGGFNTWGYHAEDVDVGAACAAAASAPTRERARNVLADLFGFLSRDQPLVWLANAHVIRGYRDAVAGLPAVENYFSDPDPTRDLYFTRE
ncbi:MAG: ABC transporter substrate-binding protein [Halobacteriaceae archaeon]